MAKKNQSPSLVSELTAFGLYKRHQGRLTRQLTALSISIVVLFGCWSLSEGMLADSAKGVRLGVPVAFALIGCWIAFRLVHWAPFADFLIAVEAEMEKVTWASKKELKQSAIVVLVTMTFLGCALLAYDMFWQWFFRLIGFLKF